MTTTYFQRCSFNVALGGGSTVRVFCDPEDPIVMTPGVKPAGIVRVRVPRHEFTKLAGHFPVSGKSGTLELWFQRDPAGGLAADVHLAGWTVLPRIDEIHSGKDPATGNPQVYEQRWYLADQRYLLRRRSAAITMLANASDAAGAAVRAGATVRTAAQIVNAVRAALGITVVVTDPSLQDVPAPRDIDLRMADAVAEWEKCETATGHVLILRADGDYEFRKKRAGAATGLPDAQWELHSDTYQVASDAPNYAVFTSAPNRIVTEKAFTLEYFEPVGLEPSGELVNVGDLSYRTDEYADWGEAIRDYFKKYGQTNQHLAYRSIGRMFMLREEYKPLYLPLLAERVSAANGERLCARVAHAGSHVNAANETFNAATPLEVDGTQFDGRRGLIILPYPAWKLNEDGEDPDEFYEEFERFLQGDEFRVDAAYEARAGDTTDFFMVAYQRGDGGTGAPVKLDGPAAYLNADDAAVIRMEHWRPYRLGTEVLNQAAMETEAAGLAAGVLSYGLEGSRQRVFKGFWPVQCNGLISEVIWDFDALTTTVKWSAFQLPASRYERAKAVAGGGAKNAPGGSADRAALDRAGYESRTGAAAAAPPARPGFGVAGVPLTASGLKAFRARITGQTALGGNKWSYLFEEIEKTAAAYGGWAALSEGRTGTAYNGCEDINDGAGLEGNGVDVDGVDFPAGFAIQPVPVGSVVIVDVVKIAGNREYWFNCENAIDGTCEAP